MGKAGNPSVHFAIKSINVFDQSNPDRPTFIWFHLEEREISIINLH